MKYKITIKEVTTDEKGYNKYQDVYEQYVDSLDVYAIIQAVNKKSE